MADIPINKSRGKRYIGGASPILPAYIKGDAPPPNNPPGSGSLGNFVTLDTAQTITAKKIFNADVESNKFVTTGGTASDFVKGDGSLDSASYALTSSSITAVTLTTTLLTLFNGVGNFITSIPTWNQNTTGNAATSTSLQNARTINGTSFNGTDNITTANWGTVRTITIGNTPKSVNGSINVSWSLAEIGAEPIELITVTNGETGIGAVKYNGTTKESGSFYGGTTAPSSTNRLNYDGAFYATNVISRLSSSTTSVSNTYFSRSILISGITNSSSFSVSVVSSNIELISVKARGGTTNAVAVVMVSNIGGTVTINTLISVNLTVATATNAVSFTNTSGVTLTFDTNVINLNNSPF